MEDPAGAVARRAHLDVSRRRAGHVSPGADHRGHRRRGRVDAPLESSGDGGRVPARGRGPARLRRRAGRVLAHVQALATGGQGRARLRAWSRTYTDKRRRRMYFTDDSLFPENMQPLIITAAPYGPVWLPEDYPEDIDVSWEAQVQKAVDCYNAGATMLHIHVRDPKTGHISKNFKEYSD